MAAEKNGYDLTLGITNKLLPYLPFVPAAADGGVVSIEYRLIAAAIVGLASWTGIVLSLRQLMKLLLKYHG